jgi:hypothetical protein
VIFDRRREDHPAKLQADRETFARQLLDELAGRPYYADLPLALRPGERALFVMGAVFLFEPGPSGADQGGSADVSILPETPMRFRMGRTRGTYTRAPEEPTLIDSGSATITDRRVVFQGTRDVREWDLTKLLGYLHDPERAITAIEVEGPEEVAGIAYAGVDPARVRLALDVAEACANGHEADAVADVRAMLPPDPVVPVAPSQPATVPAGWYPDPAGRHQWRWWEGTAWAADVSDDGVGGLDPAN